ncbi:hypothetical protein SEA_CHADMASTERC_7 [Gordonia phage ChadMasterC]|uniref:Uncharacterized protein n=1 Tax=Gordonia phage Geodirt TaxID=2483670 RepID=A0A3G3M8Y7_9CAUD|nr:hypothetical protein KNU20_gp07 [Gordonia phage Geodirt]AYR02901.1 hypothetical protein SEA_GEODIRT_7 [Gordonia phage Geodirt]UQT02024.1 hypothetical protein SEA_CHADMASTERC_7 [Gordonia phage ChadMasterC]
MTSTEILAKLAALPPMPAVVAENMIYAQGWKPNAAEQAAIDYRADLSESLGMSRAVHVPVHDSHGARIGHITF